MELSLSNITGFTTGTFHGKIIERPQRGASQLGAASPGAMETSDHDYLRFTSDWQYESPFFHLPREVRDQIYDFAFGSDTFTIKYAALDFRITPTYYHPKDVLPLRYIPPPPRGIPAWIRSCKHICVEALELLGRLRAFEPIVLDHVVEASKAHHQNPILFQTGILRNILLNPNCYVLERKVLRVQHLDASGQDQLAKFLNFLHELNFKNLSLYTTWSRDWHQMCMLHNRSCWPSYNHPDLLMDEPEAFFNEWKGIWNGMFQRIQITLHFFAPPTVQDASLLILQAAEVFAERLVGEGARLSLAYLGMIDVGSREGLWRTRVTAKRLLEE